MYQNCVSVVSFDKVSFKMDDSRVQCNTYHGRLGFEKKGCELYSHPICECNFIFYVPVFMEVAALRKRDVNWTITLPMHATSFSIFQFSWRWQL